MKPRRLPDFEARSVALFATMKMARTRPAWQAAPRAPGWAVASSIRNSIQPSAGQHVHGWASDRPGANSERSNVPSELSSNDVPRRRNPPAGPSSKKDGSVSSSDFDEALK